MKLRPDELIQSQWINGNMDITIPLELRKAVFGTERDGFDDFAMNAVFYVEETPVGTGRLYHDGKRFVMDNVCVLPDYRGNSIGDLMTRLLLYRSQSFAESVYITADEDIAPFFTRYGFHKTDGENEYVVKKDEIYFPTKCCGSHGACQ